MSSAPSRWPKSVYGVGTEPDPRFSLANERTFLAGVRTSLALLAAGVALSVVDTGFGSTAESTIAAVLVIAGVGAVISAWRRWMLSERALRLGEPLPGAGLGFVLMAWVAVIGTALFVALVVAT